MRFIDQSKTSNDGVGTYVLTLAICLLSLIIGGQVSETLATKILGFSLQHFPESADLSTVLSLLLMPFAFMLVALALSIKYLHKRPILSLFTSRKSFDWKRFFFAFGLWGAIMGVFLVISIYSGAAIVWNYKPETFVSLLMVSLFILPLQTTAEEVLFRGFLLQGFAKAFHKSWVSIVLTGILFGLLHWANPEVAKIGDILLVYYVVTGLFLGVITHMDDGLELGMGYHAINNVFAALIVTNNWQAFHTDALFMDKTPPSFGWESVLTLAVLQPLLLLVFARMYKWNGWKEKLLN